MKRIFSLPDGLALGHLEPGSRAGDGPRYPTDSLQRGLLLVDGPHELSGEGVGFGVPVLKRGARAVFAGEAEVAWDPRQPESVTITYLMDRAERLGGRRHSSPLLIPLDLLREAFALLYRRAPRLRRFLMAWSNGVRWLLRVRTRFEPIPLVARIPVTYAVGAGSPELDVCVDLRDVPPEVTEVVVMNELGAQYFDVYAEAGGRTERGRAIGAWDRVGAASAAFGSTGDVWFRLQSDPDPETTGARLYRGREQARGRLAWAGFGYCLRPGPARFAYTVRFERRASDPRADEVRAGGRQAGGFRADERRASDPRTGDA